MRRINLLKRNYKYTCMQRQDLTVSEKQANESQIKMAVRGTAVSDRSFNT
jgi:hypothetical protein